MARWAHLMDDETMTSTTDRSEQTGTKRSKRLTRGDDRRIAGVASGIADYFDIDPTLVRLIFVISMVLTLGTSLLAYLILWIVLPTNDGDSVMHGGRRDQPVLMIVLGLVAVLLVAGAIGDVRFGLFNSGIVLPILLIGAGAVLLRQRSTRSHDPVTSLESSEPKTDDPPVDDPDPIPGSTTDGPPMDPSDSAAQPSIDVPKRKPPKEPRSPSLITPVVLSLMMICVGVGLALDDVTGVADVQLTTVAGAWLLLIAAGLMLATVRGHARGLIPLGIMASLGLMAALVLDPIIDDGTGERIHTVASLDDLSDIYRLGAGELTVDLSELDLDGETRTIEIKLAVGHLVVLLPSESALDLTIDNSIGSAVFHDLVDGRTDRNSGLGNKLTKVDADGDGLLIVSISQRIGETEVTRVQ